ncbi:MAG: hypothetical protein CMG46_09625 [Candidatus Marinimicrobia bacterium]|nr:hypothetical protein [Candidatus Neomarinimicrobiota bacterium]
MINGFKYNGMLAAFATVALAACTQAEVDVVYTGLEASPEVGGPAVMSRLTQDQYKNVISDVFGNTVTLGGRFEPDNRVGHLIAVGAGQASITASGLEQYDKMARSLAEQITSEENREQYLGCVPEVSTAPDDSCSREVLSRVGKLLFRRPLSEMELERYVQASADATLKVDDFYHGLGLGLAGLLSSPQFLFRHEVTEADPQNPGQLRLNAYSKASRLSFFIWNTSPDPALLAAAENGELHTKRGLQKQVDRMLNSPLLEDGVRAFFIDMLEFDRFDTLAKDATIYPKFTFAAADNAREQTLKTVIDHLVTKNGDYRGLFTTKDTFLTPLLGSMYRVPVMVPDGLPDAWVPYTFDEGSQQAGIITQASFVALHSHPGRSSPTLRGMALREVLMCQIVPDPPGAVNFDIIQDTFNPNLKTVRLRLLAHSSEPMCAGCHKITDPMGLALENFDTAGGFRSTENGVPIDTTGELDGKTFEGPDGLGQALFNSPAVTECLVNRVYAYGTGRKATKAEEDWLKTTVKNRFAADGYSVPQLLRSIATSDSFYRVIPSEAKSEIASSFLN